MANLAISSGAIWKISQSFGSIKMLDWLNKTPEAMTQEWPLIKHSETFRVTNILGWNYCGRYVYYTLCTVCCQGVFPSRTSILIFVSAHFNPRQKDIETKYLSVKVSKMLYILHSSLCNFHINLYSIGKIGVTNKFLFVFLVNFVWDGVSWNVFSCFDPL